MAPVVEKKGFTMVSYLYDRLIRGEPVTVRTLPCGPSPGGKKFTIHPVYWGTMVLGFKLEVNGKIVREHRGEIFGKAKMDEWAVLLEEDTVMPAFADPPDGGDAR